MVLSKLMIAADARPAGRVARLYAADSFRGLWMGCVVRQPRSARNDEQSSLKSCTLCGGFFSKLTGMRAGDSWRRRPSTVLAR